MPTTLIDLNTAPLKNWHGDCPRFRKWFCRKSRLRISSSPCPCSHSLAGITGSLKNMMDLPPAHYSGCGGIWNKAEFHRDIHQAIVDLNRYRKADLTLMDASVGMPDYHLGGRNCEPPVNQLVADLIPWPWTGKPRNCWG
ncbi:MAG: DUF362 domain-containing protein [Desulfobacterales bacterium]